MDSRPVNWEALDALVIEFAKSEKLIDDDRWSTFPSAAPSPSVSSSAYSSRLIIRQIRRLIEAGEIDGAIDLLRSHAPPVLDDHRLLFRLQKQKFIELLRRGTPEARQSAIECLRNSLAPCALDAYPEAYEEFKHILLAFIFDKNDQSSPVANEWAEGRRLEIAGLMCSVLRAHLQAYDPIFALTLRYLISIHNTFCIGQQGVLSPISDLTKRLLFEETDPPAIPSESLYKVPPFDEVDVQALAHAVELTRQGAVDSLRFTKGDLFQAFQNELCRIRLNVPMLDELVREYCVYRGIVEADYPSSAGEVNFSEHSTNPQVEHSPPRSSSLERDCTVPNHSDGEISTGNAYINCSPENSMNMESTDIELRSACEAGSNFGSCSTSGSNKPESSRITPGSRSRGNGESSKRKRWRGRHDEYFGTSYVPYGDSGNQDIGAAISSPSANLSRKKLGVENLGLEEKFKIVLGVKELASKGMASEVVEEINAMDPKFFIQNPILFFQLKQVEFLKLVNLGDLADALRVASSFLGPIAAKDPGLLRPLKETLLSLLQPNEDAFRKSLSFDALATSLQVAIGRRLGIEEPQLMRIMRATLHTHTECFKLQQCKDRFEGFLRIDCLKEYSTPLLASSPATKSNSGSNNLGSSQATVSSSTHVSDDGSSPNQASSGDVWDENAILKVMEFLALPRADAIHLLAQCNGNAETVIQQLFT